MGCAIVALPVEGLTISSIQAALNSHRKVKLPDGAVINMTAPLYIPDGRKLYSNPANPATFKRIPLTRQRMLVFNGRNSIIAHLIMDFNFATGWEPYVICIAFSAEEFVSITPQNKSGCRVYNVQFIESNGVVVHPVVQTGDSWCISFATDFSGAVQEDIKVIGCNCTAEWHQLTANGQGPGQRSITIEHNKIKGSYATAIAISSRTDPSVMEDITIRHNFLLRCRAYGTFVGQDTQEVVAIKLDLGGILIDKNYVSQDGSRLFQTSFVFRGGLNGGTISNCVVSNNISDATESQGMEPRSVSYQSDTEDSDFQFYNNKSIRFAKSVLINAEITQSGNEYVLTGLPWTLGD